VSKLQSEAGSGFAGIPRQFGRAVAIDGKTAIVGDPFVTNPDGTIGAAFVYHDTQDGWLQVATLAPSDGLEGELTLFGASVAISGSHAIVGAGLDDHGDVSGSAYVFQDTGVGWQEVAKLRGGALADGFGIDVAIDQSIAVVGALADDAREFNAGAAYVFQATGKEWKLIAQLTPLDSQSFDEFGESVDIDGRRIMVGADREGDSDLSSLAAQTTVSNGSVELRLGEEQGMGVIRGGLASALGGGRGFGACGSTRRARPLPAPRLRHRRDARVGRTSGPPRVPSGSIG
jgi:hypothetical protein